MHIFLVPRQYNYWTASSDYSCHMYTEEIVLDLDCAEMNELECDPNLNCIWVEDFQLENCYGVSWDEQDCEALEGCSWWTSNYYGTSNCAGSYQLDTSYCEDISFLPGDANGDGVLNISDIILSVYFIINNQYDIDSDYNQDGIHNVIDIIESVNNIIGS